MSQLRVVGAGGGRTGTHSLKLALERLLGGPCYHMVEVTAHPAHIHIWQAAAQGILPDWDALLADYVAAVDWPVAAFWSELANAYPHALILLSTRPTQDWWSSARQTIFETIDITPDDPVAVARRRMSRAVFAARFTPHYRDERAACLAYERHNASVRSLVPAGRLVEWSPGDGWQPLCAALTLPVPDEPFPHVNTAEEFRTLAGLDSARS